MQVGIIDGRLAGFVTGPSLADTHKVTLIDLLDELSLTMNLAWFSGFTRSFIDKTIRTLTAPFKPLHYPGLRFRVKVLPGVLTNQRLGVDLNQHNMIIPMKGFISVWSLGDLSVPVTRTGIRLCQTCFMEDT